MISRIWNVRLLALGGCFVALPAASACADLSESRHVAGTFALVDINGVAPPVVVPKDADLGVGLQTIVVADTLRFVHGGTGQWTHTAYREPIGGGAPDDASWAYCSRYERSGESVYLQFRPCGGGYQWIFGDDASLVSDDTLVRNYFGAWRYVRVPAPTAP